MLPTSLNYKALVIGVAGLAIAIALYFLVAAPRIELSREREEKAQTTAKRQAVASQAQAIINQAAADVQAEHAAIVDDVAAKSAPAVRHDRIIRQKIVERAVVDGDPLVSEGMQEFYDELRKGDEQ
jgi:hypothetical protein